MASCDTVNNVIKWVCVGLGITAGGIVLGTGIKEGIKFWAENNPAAIAAKQAGGLAAGGLSLAAGSLNAAEAKGLSIPGGGIEMTNLSGNIPNSTDLTKMANNQVTNATNVVTSQVANAQAQAQKQMGNLTSQVANAQADLTSQVSNAQADLTSQVSNTKDAVQGQMDSVTSQATDLKDAGLNTITDLQNQATSQITDKSDKLNSTLAAVREERKARIAQGLQATSNLANTANTFTRSVKDGVVVNTPKTLPKRGTVIFSGEHSDGDPENMVESSTGNERRRIGPNRGGGRKTKNNRSKLTNSEPRVKKSVKRQKKTRTKKCLIEKNNKMYMSFCI
jgi:hypothetical protein